MMRGRWVREIRNSSGAPVNYSNTDQLTQQDSEATQASDMKILNPHP